MVVAHCMGMGYNALSSYSHAITGLRDWGVYSLQSTGKGIVGGTFVDSRE